MPIGIVQLGVLAYARKKTQENGFADYKALKKFAKESLAVSSTVQVSITIKRLLNDGLLRDMRCDRISYVGNPSIEAELQRSFFQLRSIMELADD